jgi:hypothetical protein
MGVRILVDLTAGSEGRRWYNIAYSLHLSFFLCYQDLFFSPQRLQIDILLGGFSTRSDFAGIFEKEVVKVTSDEFDDIDFTYINMLFELNHRMVRYLHTATVREGLVGLSNYRMMW